MQVCAEDETHDDGKATKALQGTWVSFGWSQVELFIICLYLFGLMVFICFYGFSCFPFEPERVKE
jgi:hypothetical protein